MTTTFTRMDASTKEDWEAIGKEHFEYDKQIPNNIKELLHKLESMQLGFAVNQLTHCLQTATRAERGGASEEMIVASLCHDMGKAISEANHPAIAAEILKPYVSAEVYWVILTHQAFQGRHYFQHFGASPNLRDSFKGHPAYELAEKFADEWDQTSFDPNYDTYPLEHFEPMIDRVFSNPRRFQ